MGAVQFFFLNSHISFYIVAYLGLASCWVLSHQEDTGFLYPSRVPIEYAGCNGGKSFSTQAANDQQQAFHNPHVHKKPCGHFHVFPAELFPAIL